MKKTVAEQLAALTATRVEKSARMEEIMQGAAEAGRSTDAAEAEEFDTLAGELKTIDADVARLKTMEAIQIAKAAPVAGGSSADATASRGGVNVKNTQKLEPGIEFARFAICKLAAKGNPQMALQIAQNRYADNEGVVKALQFEASGVQFGEMLAQKAAIGAGTTTGTTWAAPLVDYERFTGDFVEFLRPRTIIGQFGVGSVPSLNRVPFNVDIGGQTSGGSASWVGEGAPKPLTSFDFNNTRIGWSKVAAISVLTNELIRFSNPSAERLVRDGLAGAVIARIDTDFVDPTKAAVANVSPASITNGANNFASSGPTADNIRADIMRLWQFFIAARNTPRNAVYLMNSSVALALSLMQNPLGQSEFPGLTMNGGTFMGVPVIVSDYIPYTSAGSIVILANASDIWLADDGQVTVDASQEASLQMDTAPTVNSATPTAIAMVSMFQTNSTAFRAERYIGWLRRRASAVAYITAVNWGES
jgi:HK97 family phage major capsid protein